MAGLLQTLTDPLLKSTMKQIDAAIPPELKRDYLAIVTAGLSMMYNRKTHPLMVEYLDQVKQAQYNPTMIAHGVVKMLSIIHRESKGQINVGVAPAAALVLLLYVLEYMEKTQGFDATKEVLAETSMQVMAGLNTLFGMTDKKIHEAVKRGSGPEAASASPGQSVPPGPQSAAPGPTAPPVAPGSAPVGV